MFQSRMLKVFIVVVVALTVATAAQALAAANTGIPVDTKAGDGSETISGYVVSNLDYNLNGTNPANIDSVTFTLNNAAVTVKASLVASGTLYDCADQGSNNWLCDTTSPQATVAAADQIRIIAVDR